MIEYFSVKESEQKFRLRIGIAKILLQHGLPT